MTGYVQMRWSSIVATGGLLVLACAVPATAEEQAPACQAPGVLPPGLAAWSNRQPLAAAKTSGAIRHAALQIGRAVDAKLAPTPEVKYPLRPEQKGGSVSYGGLFSLSVKQAGVYRVALGSGAWIDIVKAGKAVESVAHGPGPDCTGVRKMVDFPLKPGTYILQIAANGNPELPLLVTRIP